MSQRWPSLQVELSRCEGACLFGTDWYFLKEKLCVIILFKNKFVSYIVEFVCDNLAAAIQGWVLP